MNPLRSTLIFAGLLFFSAGFSFAQVEDDVVKVDTSLVVVNATVTDSDKKPVRNLKKAEFTVFEDGTERKIEFFETASTPFAAVILIDTSGSMETRVSLARSAAINFLDRLRLEDQVAIYNFDTEVKLVQEFSNSRDLAQSAFDLGARGYTSLNDAIFRAADELGKRPEKRKAILVISDGADTKSAKSADKALRYAMDVGATIYTVDMSQVNGGTDRIQSIGVLRNFAERSGGRFISASGGVALREAFKDIIDDLGVQYTLGFEPSEADKDGKWRNIELRVSRPNLTIRTRKGYHAKKSR